MRKSDIFCCRVFELPKESDFCLELGSECWDIEIWSICSVVGFGGLIIRIMETQMDEMDVGSM